MFLSFSHPLTSYHNICPTSSPLWLLPLLLQFITPKTLHTSVQPKSWNRRVLCIILCRFTLHQHPTDLAVDVAFRCLFVDGTTSETTDLSVQSITSFCASNWMLPGRVQPVLFIPGCVPHLPFRWDYLHVSVQKIRPRRQVPRLYVPPSPGTQGVIDQDPLTLR